MKIAITDMKTKLSLFLLCLIPALIAAVVAPVQPLKPFGAIPSERRQGKSQKPPNAKDLGNDKVFNADSFAAFPGSELPG